MNDQRSPAIWDEAAEALPGMARIAATAWMRSAAWTVGAGVRSGRAFGRALTNPATAGELVQEVARDVAEAVVFFSSAGAARQITGQVLSVSGGYSMP